MHICCSMRAPLHMFYSCAILYCSVWAFSRDFFTAFWHCYRVFSLLSFVVVTIFAITHVCRWTIYSTWWTPTHHKQQFVCWTHFCCTLFLSCVILFYLFNHHLNYWGTQLIFDGRFHRRGCCPCYWELIANYHIGINTNKCCFAVNPFIAGWVHHE